MADLCLKSAIILLILILVRINSHYVNRPSRASREQSRAVAQQRMGFLPVHSHQQPPIVQVLALLHDPVYREANAEALRMERPRIPLPDWPNGD